MEYEYRPIEEAKNGDVLYCSSDGYGCKKGEFSIVQDSAMAGIIASSKWGNVSNDTTFIELLKTKPGSEAKVGDTVMCVEPNLRYRYGERGETYVVGHIKEKGSYQQFKSTKGNIYYWTKDFVVLCQASPETTENQCVGTPMPINPNSRTNSAATPMKRENKMNENKMNEIDADKIARQILGITCNGQRKTKTKKPKTQLQKAKKIVLEVVYFNSNGNAVENEVFYKNKKKSLMKATRRLKDADTRGWTMRNITDGNFVTEEIKLVTGKG